MLPRALVLFLFLLSVDVYSSTELDVVTQMIPYLCHEEGPLAGVELTKVSKDCRKFVPLIEKGNADQIKVSQLPFGLRYRIQNLVRFLGMQASESRKAVTQDMLESGLQNSLTQSRLRRLKEKTYRELAISFGDETVYPETGGEAYLVKLRNGKYYLDLVEIESSSQVALRKINNCGYDWKCLNDLYVKDEVLISSCDEAGLIKAFLGRVQKIEEKKGQEKARESYDSVRSTALSSCGNSYWVTQEERLKFAMNHTHRGTYIGPWHTHPGENFDSSGDGYMSPDDLALAEAQGRAIMIQFGPQFNFTLYESNHLAGAGSVSN